MAKIYGLFGAMSGKVADVVMSVRNGQQIVRKYQPVVSNPKTANQYTTRARFKLVSQLSAVFASVIAIPRRGGISSRNLFTKLNFPFTSFSDDTATIDMLNILITDSVVALPDITAERLTDFIQVSIGRAAGTELDYVVYAAFLRQQDNKLRLLGTAVGQEPGANNTFPASLPIAYGEVFIYSYGVRINNEKTRSRFGNLEVLSATQIAQLVVSSSLSDEDITLTETKATYMLPANKAISEENDAIEIPKSSKKTTKE